MHTASGHEEQPFVVLSGYLIYYYYYYYQRWTEPYGECVSSHVLLSL